MLQLQILFNERRKTVKIFVNCLKKANTYLFIKNGYFISKYRFLKAIVKGKKLYIALSEMNTGKKSKPKSRNFVNEKHKKNYEEGPHRNASAIRNQYAALGVENYYITFGSEYKNPHEPQLIAGLHKFFKQLKAEPYCIDICDTSQKLQKYLDLCCGSGEMTLGLCQYLMKSNKYKEWYKGIEITGNDPYTYDAYTNRIFGKQANESDNSKSVLQTIVQSNVLKYTFVDIVGGCLTEKHYDMILCSYALHLCSEKSLLQSLCWNLHLISSYLLIVTPHKKPDISVCWGWSLLYESLIDRVRFRFYKSQRLADKAEMIKNIPTNAPTSCEEKCSSS
ncbi:conserved fungal protein [Reticulomyxa filosa]|uniref:Conserved fungal protein n=1 Tax=Reticulomyxa filosa TaxID=46433 RepID=X6PBI7_RETFI|nr:conserved fungal protein [Reticulomyxa filosa]|eukprot:ETO35551.1 conserved fungal protein [Reticulomyxa filosa]